MATFTESQISDLAECIGSNSDLVSARLDLEGSLITDSDKTKVLSLVSEWQELDADDDGARTKANDRNFGSEFSPDTRMNKLANRIARFIRCSDLCSAGQSRLIRA